MNSSELCKASVVTNILLFYQFVINLLAGFFMKKWLYILRDACHARMKIMKEEAEQAKKEGKGKKKKDKKKKKEEAA
jgi:hypothetical protein